MEPDNVTRRFFRTLHIKTPKAIGKRSKLMAIHLYLKKNHWDMIRIIMNIK